MELDGPAIRRGVVSLKSLPFPDQMDFDLPAGHCCLLVDDGTDLTVQTLDLLAARGWPVGVLRLPPTVVTRSQGFPKGTPQVQLADLSEEQLTACLAEIARQMGPAAVFIYLQPACQDCQGEGLHFSEYGREVLQAVFLIAKHLKESLNNAAHLGRAAFLTVVRLDGEFGLGNRNDYDPVSGGLFGLVKSLNLEWESVFCRAVDLDPEIAPEQAAQNLMAELLDPNRLVVEIGYGPAGRTTLGLEAANA
jgi:hypothetical protein